MVLGHHATSNKSKNKNNNDSSADVTVDNNNSTENNTSDSNNRSADPTTTTGNGDHSGSFGCELTVRTSRSRWSRPIAIVTQNPPVESLPAAYGRLILPLIQQGPAPQFDFSTTRGRRGAINIGYGQNSFRSWNRIPHSRGGGCYKMQMRGGFAQRRPHKPRHYNGQSNQPAGARVKLNATAGLANRSSSAGAPLAQQQTAMNRRESRHVRVEGLSTNVATDRLAAFFAQFGRVQRVSRPDAADPTVALVSFNDVRSAQKAYLAAPKFDGRPLRIHFDDPPPSAALATIVLTATSTVGAPLARSESSVFAVSGGESSGDASDSPAKIVRPASAAAGPSSSRYSSESGSAQRRLFADDNSSKPSTKSEADPLKSEPSTSKADAFDRPHSPASDNSAERRSADVTSAGGKRRGASKERATKLAISTNDGAGPSKSTESVISPVDTQIKEASDKTPASISPPLPPPPPLDEESSDGAPPRLGLSSHSSAAVTPHHKNASRTLFVGGLERNVTDEQLVARFAVYGHVLDVDVKNREAPAPFAFIQFTSIDAVAAAIAACNGRSPAGNLALKPLKANWGKSICSNKLWIGALPASYSDEYLRSKMKVIAPDDTLTELLYDAPACEAIAIFKSNDAAQAAFHKIKGRVVTFPSEKPGGDPAHVQIDFCSEKLHNYFIDRKFGRTTTASALAPPPDPPKSLMTADALPPPPSISVTDTDASGAGHVIPPDPAMTSGANTSGESRVRHTSGEHSRSSGHWRAEGGGHSTRHHSSASSRDRDRDRDRNRERDRDRRSRSRSRKTSARPPTSRRPERDLSPLSTPSTSASGGSSSYSSDDGSEAGSADSADYRNRRDRELTRRSAVGERERVRHVSSSSSRLPKYERKRSRRRRRRHRRDGRRSSRERSTSSAANGASRHRTGSKPGLSGDSRRSADLLSRASKERSERYDDDRTTPNRSHVSPVATGANATPIFRHSFEALPPPLPSTAGASVEPTATAAESVAPAGRPALSNANAPAAIGTTASNTIASSDANPQHRTSLESRLRSLQERKVVPVSPATPAKANTPVPVPKATLYLKSATSTERTPSAASTPKTSGAARKSHAEPGPASSVASTSTSTSGRPLLKTAITIPLEASVASRDPRDATKTRHAVVVVGAFALPLPRFAAVCRAATKTRRSGSGDADVVSVAAEENSVASQTPASATPKSTSLTASRTGASSAGVFQFAEKREEFSKSITAENSPKADDKKAPSPTRLTTAIEGPSTTETTEIVHDIQTEENEDKTANQKRPDGDSDVEPSHLSAGSSYIHTDEEDELQDDNEMEVGGTLDAGAALAANLLDAARSFKAAAGAAPSRLAQRFSELRDRFNDAEQNIKKIKLNGAGTGQPDTISTRRPTSIEEELERLRAKENIAAEISAATTESSTITTVKTEPTTVITQLIDLPATITIEPPVSTLSVVTVAKMEIVDTVDKVSPDFVDTNETKPPVVQTTGVASKPLAPIPLAAFSPVALSADAMSAAWKVSAPTASVVTAAGSTHTHTPAAKDCRTNSAGHRTLDNLFRQQANSSKRVSIGSKTSTSLLTPHERPALLTPTATVTVQKVESREDAPAISRNRLKSEPRADFAPRKSSDDVEKKKSKEKDKERDKERLKSKKKKKDKEKDGEKGKERDKDAEKKKKHEKKRQDAEAKEKRRAEKEEARREAKRRKRRAPSFSDSDSSDGPAGSDGGGGDASDGSLSGFGLSAADLEEQRRMLKQIQAGNFGISMYDRVKRRSGVHSKLSTSSSVAGNDKKSQALEKLREQSSKKKINRVRLSSTSSGGSRSSSVDALPTVLLQRRGASDDSDAAAAARGSGSEPSSDMEHQPSALVEKHKLKSKKSTFSKEKEKVRSTAIFYTDGDDESDSESIVKRHEKEKEKPRKEKEKTNKKERRHSDVQRKVKEELNEPKELKELTELKELELIKKSKHEAPKEKEPITMEKHEPKEKEVTVKPEPTKAEDRVTPRKLAPVQPTRPASAASSDGASTSNSDDSNATSTDGESYIKSLRKELSKCRSSTASDGAEDSDASTPAQPEFTSAAGGSVGAAEPTLQFARLKPPQLQSPSKRAKGRPSKKNSMKSSRISMDDVFGNDSSGDETITEPIATKPPKKDDTMVKPEPVAEVDQSAKKRKNKSDAAGDLLSSPAKKKTAVGSETPQFQIQPQVQPAIVPKTKKRTAELEKHAVEGKRTKMEPVEVSSITNSHSHPQLQSQPQPLLQVSTGHLSPKKGDAEKKTTDELEQQRSHQQQSHHKQQVEQQQQQQPHHKQQIAPQQSLVKLIAKAAPIVTSRSKPKSHTATSFSGSSSNSSSSSSDDDDDMKCSSSAFQRSKITATVTAAAPKRSPASLSARSGITSAMAQSLSFMEEHNRRQSETLSKPQTLSNTISGLTASSAADAKSTLSKSFVKAADLSTTATTVLNYDKTPAAHHTSASPIKTSSHRQPAVIAAHDIQKMVEELSSSSSGFEVIDQGTVSASILPVAEMKPAAATVVSSPAAAIAGKKGKRQGRPPKSIAVAAAAAAAAAAAEEKKRLDENDEEEEARMEAELLQRMREEEEAAVLLLGAGVFDTGQSATPAIETAQITNDKAHRDMFQAVKSPVQVQPQATPTPSAGSLSKAAAAAAKKANAAAAAAAKKKEQEEEAAAKAEETKIAKEAAAQKEQEEAAKAAAKAAATAASKAAKVKPSTKTDSFASNASASEDSGSEMSVKADEKQPAPAAGGAVARRPSADFIDNGSGYMEIDAEHLLRQQQEEERREQERRRAEELARTVDAVAAAGYPPTKQQQQPIQQQQHQQPKKILTQPDHSLSQHMQTQAHPQAQNLLGQSVVMTSVSQQMTPKTVAAANTPASVHSAHSACGTQSPYLQQPPQQQIPLQQPSQQQGFIPAVSVGAIILQSPPQATVLVQMGQQQQQQQQNVMQPTQQPQPQPQQPLTIVSQQPQQSAQQQIYGGAPMATVGGVTVVGGARPITPNNYVQQQTAQQQQQLPQQQKYVLTQASTVTTVPSNNNLLGVAQPTVYQQSPQQQQQLPVVQQQRKQATKPQLPPQQQQIAQQQQHHRYVQQVPSAYQQQSQPPQQQNARQLYQQQLPQQQQSQGVNKIGQPTTVMTGSTTVAQQQQLAQQQHGTYQQQQPPAQQQAQQQQQQKQAVGRQTIQQPVVQQAPNVVINYPQQPSQQQQQFAPIGVVTDERLLSQQNPPQQVMGGAYKQAPANNKQRQQQLQEQQRQQQLQEQQRQQQLQEQQRQQQLQEQQRQQQLQEQQRQQQLQEQQRQQQLQEQQRQQQEQQRLHALELQKQQEQQQKEQLEKQRLAQQQHLQQLQQQQQQQQRKMSTQQQQAGQKAAPAYQQLLSQQHQQQLQQQQQQGQQQRPEGSGTPFAHLLQLQGMNQEQMNAMLGGYTVAGGQKPQQQQTQSQQQQQLQQQQQKLQQQQAQQQKMPQQTAMPQIPQLSRPQSVMPSGADTSGSDQHPANLPADLATAAASGASPEQLLALWRSQLSFVNNTPAAAGAALYARTLAAPAAAVATATQPQTQAQVPQQSLRNFSGPSTTTAAQQPSGVPSDFDLLRQAFQQQQQQKLPAANLTSQQQNAYLAQQHLQQQSQQHQLQQQQQQQMQQQQMQQQQQLAPRQPRDKYPVLWTGQLAMKTTDALVQMHRVHGNERFMELTRQELMSRVDGTQIIRITQRMRREASHLEALMRKMESDETYMSLVCLPCGRNRDDIALQTSRMTKNFIEYFTEKMAAGIISQGPAPSQTAPSCVAHVFPPCDFATNHMSRHAPDLLNRIGMNANQCYLFVVITHPS